MSRYKNNDQSLKDAIEEWIKQYRYQNKYEEEKAILAWNSLVGVMIVKETEQIYIKNKILIVKLRSQALKYELEFAKRKLITKINKKVNYDVITDIHFI